MSTIYAELGIMENYFRGLKTQNIEEARVILTGVPYDKNASIGKGASLAPQTIRTLSAFFPPLSMDGDLVSECKLYDRGDVLPNDDDTITYFKRVEESLKEALETNKFNLVLGGDHSIAIASEKAFYDYAKKMGKIPAIIHLDAHPDICDIYEGKKYSHACPIRRAIEAGYKTEDIVLVGIRGFEQQEVEYFALHPEIKMFKSSWIKENGIKPIIEFLKSKFDNRYLVYLSYDIDCNDPCFAPGTGTPESFGVDSYELLNLIRFIIAKMPVQMMDIVEIAPPLDVNDVTTWLGLKTMYEIFKELIARK